MKIFYLLVSLLVFAGCNKQKLNEIILVGHLNEIPLTTVSLSSDDINFTVPVDSDGTFVFKLVSDKPRMYQISLKNNLNLFLIPGDTIIIDKNGEDYKFSGGQSAVLSNYYQEWEKYWNNLTGSFDERKYYSLEPDEFNETVHLYIDTCSIPLHELIKKIPNINPEFLRLEKERLKYWLIIDLLSYEYETHKTYTGKEPAISESFHDYMKDVNLNDSSLLQLEYYKDFLYSYVKNVAGNRFQNNKELAKDKYTETNFIINFIRDEFKNQRVMDYVLYKVIYERTKNLQTDDKNLESFTKYCRNDDYTDEVDKIYDELQIIMPGKPAPDFTLYDADNKEYTLSDFKNKYLLIDVWGIYCNPCIREMPKCNELKEKFRDAYINIIQVNIDATKELWLNKSSDLNLRGTQLIAYNGWQSDFRHAYKIDVIPTFILIDKDGRFVDARTRLPSQDLESVLNNLPGIRN
jgi:thiol-disulfide isomerase/thioredoxin